MKFYDKEIDIQIGRVSLVGFYATSYPLSYGNYFTIYLDEDDNESYYVNNINYENFKEAIKRFLPDNKVKVRIFSKYSTIFKNNKSISIIDERIPQDWYTFWEDRNYCNGQLSSFKNINFVKNNLTSRFTNEKQK